MKFGDEVRGTRRITELTRREILGRLALDRVPWSGRLDEDAFLNRIYKLNELPSYDNRYSSAAGDVHQHRVNNYDWDDDWVFTDARFGLVNGSDETLLRFLAEMLHPLVTRSADEASDMRDWLNDLLRPDGYELVVASTISGRPVYRGQSREAFHGAHPDIGDQRPVLTDPGVLHEHLDRIAASVGRDPAGTIGSAKELIESLCKVILDSCNVPYGRNDDVPKLYKAVARTLGLRTEAVPGSSRGSQSAHQVLGALASTLQGLAELRNELGLGHGRSGPTVALERHARLALNAAVALSEFLLATWQERSDAGLLAVVVEADGSGAA